MPTANYYNKFNERNLIEENNKDAAKEALINAEKTLDSMAGKKVITKNKASRTKSRLSKKVKAL